MKHPQHVRLRDIFRPLIHELATLGFDTELRSMQADCFAEGKGAVNIWLATDLGELPPVSGMNILWFLPNMKVMSHVALLAYDGILSASQAHIQFLDSWIGHLRPMRQVGWPLAHCKVTSVNADAAELLKIDQASKENATRTAKIETLPSDAATLQAYLRGFKRVQTSLPLRERMCGFVLYEELVALAAGCELQSQPRSGLPDCIEQSISAMGAPDKANEKPQAKLIQTYLAEHHAPERVAKRLADLVSLAIGRKKERQEPNKKMLPAGDRNLGEYHAWLNDAAYFLNHNALTSLADHPAWTQDSDLAKPWDVAARAELDLRRLPLPWSDLSLTRSVLDGVQSGTVTLSDADVSRFGKTTRLLKLFDERLVQRPINLGALPNVPWQGVSRASQDKKRILLDVSRQLNGHCLYQFSQRASGPPKALSGLITHDENSFDPTGFLNKTGVFFHAFYLEESLASLRELAPILRAAPIYLSTDTAEKQYRLRDCLDELKWSRYAIHVTNNIGRDVFPKLVALQHSHEAHEFVLHMHSKRSPHSKSLASWGTNSVMQLAGSNRAVGSIARAFEDDPALGMIYASPPDMLNPAIAWTRNLRLAELLAAVGGIRNLPDTTHLEFPVGSMFWARTAALRNILKLSISQEHFAPEEGQEDGTLAHALERLLGVDVLGNGYFLRSVDLPKS